MNSYEIRVKIKNSIAIVLVNGYFSEEAGTKMDEVVDDLLKKGNLYIIMDFSNCKLINSPGVVALMEITMKIVDDYLGKLFFVGIDELKISVFSMAGIFHMAGIANTQEEAILKIQQEQSFKKNNAKGIPEK